MTIIIILLLSFSTHADILLQNCQFSSSLRHTQTTIIKLKRSWERERHSMWCIATSTKTIFDLKKGCESFNFYFYCRTITERRIPWKGNLCCEWTDFLCVKLQSEKWKKKVARGVCLKLFLNVIFSS